MPGLAVSKNTEISTNFCVSESTEVVRVCQLLEFQKHRILMKFLRFLKRMNQCMLILSCRFVASRAGYQPFRVASSP